MEHLKRSVWIALFAWRLFLFVSWFVFVLRVSNLLQYLVVGWKAHFSDSVQFEWFYCILWIQEELWSQRLIVYIFVPLQFSQTAQTWLMNVPLCRMKWTKWGAVTRTRLTFSNPVCAQSKCYHVFENILKCSMISRFQIWPLCAVWVYRWMSMWFADEMKIRWKLTVPEPKSCFRRKVMTGSLLIMWENRKNTCLGRCFQLMRTFVDTLCCNIMKYTFYVDFFWLFYFKIMDAKKTDLTEFWLENRLGVDLWSIVLLLVLYSIHCVQRSELQTEVKKSVVLFYIFEVYFEV